MSMLCAIAMALTLVLPVGAVDTSESVDALYDRYTISFNTNTSLFGVKNNDTMLQNTANVQSAINYVESLKLPLIGYDYIESSCLSQLNDFMNDTTGVLESYSVLLPKSRASMLLYGSVGNREFYQSFYSSYVKTLKKVPLRGDANINSFVAGLIGIGLTLGNVSNPYTISFTAFATAMGINPHDYEVHNGAFTESYFVLDAVCRGIYTKNQNGKYGSNKDELIMVFSDEYGTAEPYSILHHNTSPATTTMVSGTIQNVKTKYFDNKSTTLYQANNRYLDSTDKTAWTYTLASEAVKAVWK